jgi:hypothetical protein
MLCFRILSDLLNSHCSCAGNTQYLWLPINYVAVTFITLLLSRTPQTKREIHCCGVPALWLHFVKWPASPTFGKLFGSVFMVQDTETDNAARLCTHDSRRASSPERPLTNGLTDENHGAIYLRS